MIVLPSDRQTQTQQRLQRPRLRAADGEAQLLIKAQRRIAPGGAELQLPAAQLPGTLCRSGDQKSAQPLPAQAVLHKEEGDPAIALRPPPPLVQCKKSCKSTLQGELLQRLRGGGGPVGRALQHAPLMKTRKRTVGAEPCSAVTAQEKRLFCLQIKGGKTEILVHLLHFLSQWSIIKCFKKHITIPQTLQEVPMKIISALLAAVLLTFLLSMLMAFFRPASGEEHPIAAPRYTRRDCLCSWILAAIYAVFAFLGLGDRTAPESYARGGQDVFLSFSLREGDALGSLRYFAGIDTGEWLLEGSADGENWSPLGSIDMNYVAVLKWDELTVESRDCRFFRLSAAEPLEIGELALFAPEGRALLPAERNAAAAALFDEPERVPARQSYLNSTYFDEIYHVRTAWESLRCDGMYEITHPPLGKLILSLGLLLFGVTPFGWRFSGTMAGVLMLPLIYAFVQRLFGRRRVSIACTLVFAFDFMHFTQTRLATIDSYSVLFILGMYYYMYRFLSEEEHSLGALGLSGLFFGLGAASKWTCLYAGAGLGLLWLLYWCRSGELGKKRFWINVCFCMAAFVALPLLIYYVSYWPYGVTRGLHGVRMLCSREYLHIVLDNQRYMFRYHSGLVATHPYASRWYQWVLDLRPILYYLRYNGERRSVIMAFTSPLLCWGGALSLLGCAIRGVRRRDSRAGFILLGYFSQLLPWMGVSRLTFAYHYFPSEIFLVLAMGYVLSGLEEKGRRHYTLASAVAALLLFGLFYPCLSGAEVSARYCDWVLKWLPGWPV